MNLHHFQWKRTHFFWVFLFATNFSQVTLSTNDLQAKICDVVWIASGKIKRAKQKNQQAFFACNKMLLTFFS